MLNGFFSSLKKGFLAAGAISQGLIVQLLSLYIDYNAVPYFMFSPM